MSPFTCHCLLISFFDALFLTTPKKTRMETYWISGNWLKTMTWLSLSSMTRLTTTAVKFLGLLDVESTKLNPLSYLHIWIFRNDSLAPRCFTKYSTGIMHDGSIVIGDVTWINPVCWQLFKVYLKTCEEHKVWIICCFFGGFFSLHFRCTLSIYIKEERYNNEGQRRITKNNEGQRRITKDNEGQRRITKNNEEQRRTTKDNEG